MAKKRQFLAQISAFFRPEGLFCATRTLFLGCLTVKTYDDHLWLKLVHGLLPHFVLIYNTAYYTGGYVHRRLSYVDNMLKPVSGWVVESEVCVCVCAVCMLLYYGVCRVCSES